MKRRLALFLGVAALAAAVALLAREKPARRARSRRQELPKRLPPRPAPETRLPAPEPLATGPVGSPEAGADDSASVLEASVPPTKVPSADSERQPAMTTVGVLEPAGRAPATPPLAEPKPALSRPAPASSPLPPRAATGANGGPADASFLGALSELPTPTRRRRRLRLFRRRGRAREGVATWLPTVIVGGALLTAVIVLVVSGILGGAIELVSNWFSLF
jgi:hypothetical protein